ncbi:T9SS type A sorting domain-containing protein [Hymenobacter sp. GOD-10R]|uniref:T9SS type A sorting domain-containing protein n=1 Tax=Hymenobacter sp. GOD-10R TaxID=3093922 RepID=UPI002D77F95A|nr:T9SS type A sorting domain-containing protein [Hymenobacter sp. GOD-10R]WRQ28470.1 T9SS type A sorting domain-containing protein [Hymenobacter sp. GOD-10R]
MKTIMLLVCLVTSCLWDLPSQAQTKPATATSEPVVAANKPAESSALLTEKMETAKPSSDALKISLDTNPITKRLSVRTDSSGPTRVEINDSEGRPVVTRDLIIGNRTAVLDVSRLPTGQYIVQCTSGTRKGAKRLMLE